MVAAVVVAAVDVEDVEDVDDVGGDGLRRENRAPSQGVCQRLESGRAQIGRPAAGARGTLWMSSERITPPRKRSPAWLARRCSPAARHRQSTPGRGQSLCVSWPLLPASAPAVHSAIRNPELAAHLGESREQLGEVPEFVHGGDVAHVALEDGVEITPCPGLPAAFLLAPQHLGIPTGSADGEGGGVSAARDAKRASIQPLGLPTSGSGMDSAGSWRPRIGSLADQASRSVRVRA